MAILGQGGRYPIWGQLIYTVFLISDYSGSGGKTNSGGIGFSPAPPLSLLWR